jgi:hypothetical protein
MIDLAQIKNSIFFILGGLLLSGCVANTPSSSLSKVISDANNSSFTTTDPDVFLEKIELLLKHAKLEDNAYFSKIFDIQLAGGELESGRGNMTYACALDNPDIRNWVGMRYRYKSAPAFLSIQPHASTSNCFNPYTVNTTNPIHTAVAIRLDVKVDKLCISESDIKRHFPYAYYSESNSGFSVRYRRGTLDNPIIFGIESTRSGAVCASSFFFDQNNMYQSGSGF